MNAHSGKSRWLALLVVGYLGLLTATPWLDGSLAKMLRGEPLPGDLEKVILLAEVFAHGLGVAGILVLTATLDPRGWRVVPRLATTAYLAGLAANLVKMIVIRRRPNQWESIPEHFTATFEGFFAPLSLPWDEAFEYATQSFPSAHTATAFGLALGLSRLYPRGMKLFFTLAILAGLQRMVVHAHFLSDVMVGGAVGLTTAYLLQRQSAWTERLWRRWESTQTLSPGEPLDTLTAEDGGNVLQPGRGTHVDSTTRDSQPQRRRAG